MSRLPRPVLAMLAAAIALASLGALAQQQPSETLPGFKPNSVYDGAGIENLNIFNGDPHLTVPLGPEYPTGPGSSYQLKAHYSSRFWNLYDVPCGATEFCGMFPATRARILGKSTLGVGWTLELGTIDPQAGTNSPSLFLMPDGGTREFTEPVVGTPTLSHEVDEMRFEKLEGGGYRVRQADGTSLVLQHHYTRPVSQNGTDFVDTVSDYTRADRWGLSEVRDRFDNLLLSVTYQADNPPLESPWKVSTIELKNPSRTITFNWGKYGPWDILTSIDFPVLSSPSTSLSVVFGHAPSGLFQRTPFDSYWVQDPSGCLPLGSAYLDVPFLTSITESTNVYSFDYFLEDDIVLPETQRSTGLLTSYRLPTGTKVEYEYSSSTATLPCYLRGGNTHCASLDETGSERPDVPEPPEPDDCDDWSRTQRFIDNAPAVVTRTETDPTTGLSATTTYKRKQYAEKLPPEPGYPDLARRDKNRVLRRVIVKRPSGNGSGILATRHLFHVIVEPTAAGPGLEVERRYYDGPLADGAAVRSEVLCYDDVGGEVPPYATSCGALDADGTIPTFLLSGQTPVSREITWYGQYPSTGTECTAGVATTVACKVVQRSGWDSTAKEFAQETIAAPSSGPSSILLQGGQTDRTTTTVWDPKSGANSWQPKRYSSRKVEDHYSVPCPFPPCSVTTTTFFNEVTGALETSTVEGGSLTRTTAYAYAYGEAGYIDGDQKTETVSGAGLAGTFVTNRTFQSGLVTTSQRSGIGWSQFDVTRDPALGLVTASRDPSGLQTTYSWDPLARLASIDPPGSAATDEWTTRICYGAWNGAAQGAWALVRKGPATSCEAAIGAPAEGSETVEAYVYDGSGRLTREIRLLPNTLTGAETSNYLAVRTTERNSAGLVTAVSEWVPCGSGSTPSTCFAATTTDAYKTRYSSFDVFGRPQTITLPDGTAVTKRYDDWQTNYFAGNKLFSTDTREDTWTSNVPAADKRSYEMVRKDIFGRPIIAADPIPKGASDPESVASLTFYRHDIHDQVAEVKQSRSVLPSGTYEQVRTYTRNALGFLTSETQPETGVTTYSSFNALGLPGTKVSGGVTISTTHDPLGRVLTVSDGSADLIVNTYDETSAAGSLQKGKLTTSVRRNNYPTADYIDGFYPQGTLKDSFTYAGIGGRLSQRKTTLSNGWASPVTSWTYNNLGLVKEEYHPRIDPTYGGIFKVTTGYTAGLPTKVTVTETGDQVVVKSVAYDAAGGLASYKSGNDVITTIAPDEHGMPRPKSISATADGFTTGDFTYDGAGNITSMIKADPNGFTDSFTYDAASRLLTATYQGSPLREYGYDGWNNLTKLNGATLEVAKETNRLTGATYDARGNLIARGGESYSYDALGHQVKHTANDSKWNYLFDAANERTVKSKSPWLVRDVPVLRRDMARIVVQGRGLEPLADCLGTFADVPCGDPERGWIERFEQLDITAGCQVSPRLFCPNGTLTRVEMAVFLAKALIKPVPLTGTIGTFAYDCTGGQPPAKSFFGDVKPGDFGCAHIHYIYAREITAGCTTTTPPNYCPMTPMNHYGLEVYASKAWPSFRYVPPGATYTFRGPGGAVLTEFADGRVSKDYVYLGTRLVGTKDGSDWRYHTTDHLGSVRLTTNAAGGVVENRKYWPWGEDVDTAGARRFGFAGMERDVEVSEAMKPRYYDHARSLETAIGRFMSPDTLSGKVEDPLSWNRYTYARNNPLKYVDPDGKRDALVYGRVRDVEPGHAVAWFGQSGGAEHVVMVHSFSGEGPIPHAVIIEGTNLNQLTRDGPDSEPHPARVVDSNDPSAGNGYWNAARATDVQPVPVLKADGSPFSSGDMSRAAEGIQVQYDAGQAGKRDGTKMDCAALVNALTKALTGITVQMNVVEWGVAAKEGRVFRTPEPLRLHDVHK